jgi:hypothetical protein
MTAPLPADQLIEQRDNLLQAIAALSEEERRLASLTEARERARSDSWAASRKVSEAEAALRLATDDEPRRAVYEYANGNGNGGDPSPVDTVRLVLDQALAEDRRILQLENALDQELGTVTSRRDGAQHALYRALSALVCGSAEFQYLLDEQTRGFARLRGIRKALRLITRSLHGYMPAALSDRWQTTTSLDPDAIADGRGPILTDETLFEAWRAALDELREDPDAELPANV